MDFSLSDEDRAFRASVRDFIAAALPADLAERSSTGFHTSKADMQQWNRILAERGWSAAHWPAEYGGPGWTTLQQFLFDVECAAAGAPPLSVFGFGLFGPVLYTFGTAEQKARWIPGILSGDTFWCQGFSEPGSGSDLASLSTTAVPDGDGWRISGQKMWSTEAHMADMMFLLARTETEGQQQKGISFFALDMHDPGVSVRPTITLDEGHSVNEVFIDNVRVPGDSLIGQRGKGWDYAKFLLGNERVGVAQVPQSKRDVARLKAVARRTRSGDGLLIDDPAFRRAIARVEIDLRALEWAVLRILTGDASEPSSAASAVKIQGSVLQQQISGLLIEALGINAIPFYAQPERAAGNGTVSPSWASPDAPGAMSSFLYRRAASIYAGTNEIQRGVIAKLALKL